MKKHCYKCKTWKSTTNFYRSKRNKDGLQQECKECHKQRIINRNKSKIQEGKLTQCADCGKGFKESAMIETKRGMICHRCDNIEFLSIAKKYNESHPIQKIPFIRKSLSFWDVMMGAV